MATGVYERGNLTDKQLAVLEKMRLGNIGKKRPHSEASKEAIRKTRMNKPIRNWKGGVSVGENRRAYMLEAARKRRVLKAGAEGHHSRQDWRELKKAYNYTCAFCHKREPEIKLTEDHIIPLSKGGSDFIENIQPLCRSCNSGKKDKILICL